MKRVVSIIMPNSAPELDKEFHYNIPDSLQDSIEIGSKVRVPFGRGDKMTEGYVIGFPEDGYREKLKPVKELLGSPHFGYKELKLAEWMRKQYLVNLWDCLKCVMPPNMDTTGEKTVKAAFISADREAVIDDIENNKFKSIQQIRVLELLIENDCIPVPYILSMAGTSRAVLATLKRKGYIDFKNITVTRDPYKGRDISATKAMTLTPEQEIVVKGVDNLLKGNRFSEALIYGITGSGKTEVYMQTIELCLKMKKGAIVLVPEISLTPQMVERFKGRFGSDVAILHSRLSPGERYDQWTMIRDKKVHVVVGARSAAFAPVDNLGMIIIDEEHENSYKSEMNPKYHARDVARQRCIEENAVLILGSATPSVETYFRAKKGDIILFEMKKRTNNSKLPDVEIVDMRKELEDGNRTIFSKRLREEMNKNILQNQQTILFLNRRGHSTFVICRNCGYVVKCLNCNISMTYHLNDSRLICHYCGFTEKNPQKCPKCGSNHIRYFGSGTQKVEEDVRNEFNGVAVVRMDMDTTSKKDAHEKILKKFRDDGAGVLVGTQMVAKGHDFPKVTLVGVLAADSLLNVGDFRSAERTFQLLTQVAGRAGRAELPGRVIIQTYNTEDFSIKAACRHDYESFYENEIKLREKLQFPPFTEIVQILVNGESDKSVFDTAQQLSADLTELIKTEGKEHEIFGQAKAPLYKLRNRYRRRIIIKTKDIDAIKEILREVRMKYTEIVKKSRVNINIDINPVNMM